MADVHIGLDEIQCYFDELEDPRSTINLRHPFVSVVVMSIMGVMAGSSGPTAIAEWAQSNKEFLLETLDLPRPVKIFCNWFIRQKRWFGAEAFDNLRHSDRFDCRCQESGGSGHPRSEPEESRSSRTTSADSFGVDRIKPAFRRS